MLVCKHSKVYTCIRQYYKAKSTTATILKNKAIKIADVAMNVKMKLKQSVAVAKWKNYYKKIY